MSEIILSSSSDSVDKAIDEYTEPSSFSGFSDSNSSGSGSSSGGNTTDEYTSDVPRVPLKLSRNGSRRGLSPDPWLVQVRPHPQFRRRKRRLYIVVP